MKTDKKQRWLLCKPDHYSVVYQINPWMNVSQVPTRDIAVTQYQGLVDVFTKLGCEISFVPGIAGLPDMVFTANAGIVVGDTCVISRFKFPERRGEEGPFRAWFEQNGFVVKTVTRGTHEGEGDALFARSGVLFGGYGFRTDRAAQDEVAELLNCRELIPCELVDSRFYHLDTCFTPIDDTRALFVQSAFTKDSIRKMERHVELHAVVEAEALRFACNSVVLDNDILIPSGCPTVEALLQSWGWKTHSLAMSEYLKAGGAAKCLSLKLNRERPIP